MVFAISTRRQREKLVGVDDGHKLGEVALVTTVISIISTLGSGSGSSSGSGSGSFSPESLLVDDDDDDAVAVVAVTIADGEGAVFVVITVVLTASLTDELSSDEFFASFSFVSTF